MADRTIRAIFEARVTGAQKGMRDLSKDVEGTGKKVDGLSKDLKDLDKVKVKPEIDLEIDKVEREIADLKAEINRLDALEATPEVLIDFARAQAELGALESDLRELNGRKAEMIVSVSADTDNVESELYELKDLGKDAGSSIGDNLTDSLITAVSSAGVAVAVDDALEEGANTGGRKAGDTAGRGVVGGILDALRSIPIAGAVVGVGAAIAGGLFLAIRDGLSVEAGRDLFSARTGLDEETSARFGRAAGEAYANAWGESVEVNLDTARFALQAGIIDADASDAEIENVIAKLQGISDLFGFEVSESVRGVGNLMKTGLVKDANEAFDLIVAASRKVQSDDLIDTLNEYSTTLTELGLTGEQAFGLIAQGASAGARDADNIADTLKEMGIRIGEGLEPALLALESLGLEAEDIVSAFQKGGPGAVQAMDKVFDAMRKLEEKGGNTQEIIAALFGGPGEDLGAALYALDLSTVASALGGLEGSAGAADRALATMSDNAQAKWETAKRNIIIALDGIKGALAEAFGDDIGGVSDWITENRAPLMQFFLDVINGTLDMAEGFAEFGATGLDVIADLAEGFAGLLDAIPDWLIDGGIQGGDSLRALADGARAASEDIRREIPTALEEVREKVNTWAAPELLKARIHDATVAMTADMDDFAAKVEATGGTITINGDTVTAEEALQELIDNINGEDGTVLINGDKVPAEEALEVLMRAIDNSEDNVTIGGDTRPGRGALGALRGQVSATEASMTINANTDAAERKLAALERTRYATLQIRVAGVNSYGGLTKGPHDGGWTPMGALPGLYSGGFVPGGDPGYDNILWPLNTGGRTLMQPLAGGEFVMNSADSAYWGPLLEWMNGGGRPVQTFNETNQAPVYIDKVVGLTISEVEREAAARRRRDALSPSRRGS